jgi:hypothetical protein
LDSAQVFAGFPTAGISGLEGIMDGWYDALKRLSGDDTAKEEQA